MRIISITPVFIMVIFTDFLKIIDFFSEFELWKWIFGGFSGSIRTALNSESGLLWVHYQNWVQFWTLHGIQQTSHPDGINYNSQVTLNKIFGSFGDFLKIIVLTLCPTKSILLLHMKLKLFLPQRSVNSGKHCRKPASMSN